MTLFNLIQCITHFSYYTISYKRDIWKGSTVTNISFRRIWHLTSYAMYHTLFLLPKIPKKIMFYLPFFPYLLLLFYFSIFYLLLFTLHVLYHGRQVEIASSLDFLWKQQARSHNHSYVEESSLHFSAPCVQEGARGDVWDAAAHEPAAPEPAPPSRGKVLPRRGENIRGPLCRGQVSK